jgi:hypothetical protein
VYCSVAGLVCCAGSGHADETYVAGSITCTRLCGLHVHVLVFFWFGVYVWMPVSILSLPSDFCCNCGVHFLIVRAAFVCGGTQQVPLLQTHIVS